MSREYSKFLYESYLNNNPHVKEEDIEYWEQVTTYDIFIKFKNGKKILYQIEDNYYRPLPYQNDMLSNDEFKLEFGFRLRRFMRLRCVNQDELAKKIGTSQTMISRYMNGDVMPSANVLGKIAMVLKIPIQDFYYINL